ncbi:MAG: hypothetical protein NQU45_07280, partial [Methanothermobacter sp.]|nr:hypothetical protein [Methanothermobacter sp.]
KYLVFDKRLKGTGNFTFDVSGNLLYITHQSRTYPASTTLTLKRSTKTGILLYTSTEAESESKLRVN